ncbi:hypothetical protein [Plastoroseomonas hellenica]|uniref:hypothetical protein n=1 Tax=Plastoroseomonas hellenica TaxID=2687306 RepID=UPI001BA9AE06|nr:hypothetical protein [Plastoroseomonas hellenica]
MSASNSPGPVACEVTLVAARDAAGSNTRRLKRGRCFVAWSGKAGFARFAGPGRQNGTVLILQDFPELCRFAAGIALPYLILLLCRFAP